MGLDRVGSDRELPGDACMGMCSAHACMHTHVHMGSKGNISMRFNREKRLKQPQSACEETSLGHPCGSVWLVCNDVFACEGDAHCVNKDPKR